MIEYIDYGYSKRYTVYEKRSGRMILNTDCFEEASGYIRTHSHKTCCRFTMYDKELRTFDPKKIRAAADQ